MKRVAISVFLGMGLWVAAPLASAQPADQWLESQFMDACQTPPNDRRRHDTDILEAYDCSCMAPMLAKTLAEARLDSSKEYVAQTVKLFTRRPWTGVVHLPEGLEDRVLSLEEIDEYTKIVRANLEIIRKSESRAEGEAISFSLALKIINSTASWEAIYEEGLAKETHGWLIEAQAEQSVKAVHRLARSIANGNDGQNRDESSRAVAEACIMPNYSKTLTPLEKAASNSYSTEFEEFIALSIAHCDMGGGLADRYSCEGISDYVTKDGLVIPKPEKSELDLQMDAVLAEMDKKIEGKFHDPNPVREYEKPLAEIDPKDTLSFLLKYNDDAERALRSREKMKKKEKAKCSTPRYSDFTDVEVEAYCECVSDYVADEYMKSKKSMVYSVSSKWLVPRRVSAAGLCK